jgi:hypothetical protein
MNQPIIFFVGIHNKPGRLPLDSHTRTGSVIDAIIARLSPVTIKTNLCDVDEFPRPDEIMEHNDAWHLKNNPTEDDLIVLLGTWVGENFRKRGLRVLKLGHPAGAFRRGAKEEYIQSAIEKINKAL